MPHLAEGYDPAIQEIDLARQVDELYEEAVCRELGGLSLGYLNPTAKDTNTGGHQGGNSEFGNPQKDRYEGDKAGNSGNNGSKK